LSVLDAHAYERRILVEVENEEGRTASTVRSIVSLRLDRAFRSVEEEELAALLYLGVLKGDYLAFVINFA
jgi:hypothetical protein